jgi:hypothetical protein
MGWGRALLQRAGTDAAYESERKIQGWRSRHQFLDAGRSNGVVCEITIEALSQLRRASGLTEPTGIFETTRDAIERVVTDKYDRTSREPYEVVTITTDDLEP